MFKLFLFLPFFIKEVIASNIEVMRLIITGNISPVIETVDVRQISPFKAWLLGTMITMTPGTLTIEYVDGYLVVQFLNKDSIAGFYDSFYRKYLKCWS